MPLVTRITRDGSPVQIRWGWFHVRCMRKVVEMETGSDQALVSLGRYVVREPHGFVDPEDGEVFDIWPGDILEMWHEFK